jgi:hypothetical protein
MNKYLFKQIEIHQITNGNCDILIDMAHKLGMRTDEIENYREKISKCVDLNDSLSKRSSTTDTIANSLINTSRTS